MTKTFYFAQKYRKLIQIMAIIIFLTYLSLFFYQNVCGFSVNSRISGNNLDRNNFSNKEELKSSEWQNNLKNGSLMLHKILNIPMATTSETANKPAEQRLSSYHQMDVLNTPTVPTIELDDLFISVKTTKDYHDTRLSMIIKTWFQLAKDQTWFFTDTDDDYYQKLTNNHMIHTNCSAGHFRKALCCKMGKEFDYFLNSAKKYWCHFDDDNYVNVPKLVDVLKRYSATQEWYLGKPSISSPIEMLLDDANSLMTSMTSSMTTTKSQKPQLNEKNKKVKFWFATGGAGFCISRALAMKMMPVAGDGKFVTIGDKIRFPDDVTMGFIIEYLLKTNLTVVDAFHSHLEPMEFIRQETFQDQISFSYAKIKNEWNIIKIDGGFDLKTDPKRFYSLHCHLFPYFSYCSR